MGLRTARTIATRALRCRRSPRAPRPIVSRGNDVSKLLELMRKLGSDAALAAEYDKDPGGVLRRAGLSDEERKAMVAKDYAAIRQLTGLQDGQFATNHTIKAYEK